MTLVKMNEVDLHICSNCDGKCPYCYVDQNGGSNELFKNLPLFGDTETLKQIIENIWYAALAKNLVFVGGDPCRHPDLAELLRYAKNDLGGMDICVLSNTHSYRKGGKIVPIDDIVPYVDELDFTLHGIGAAHDAINGNRGAYEHGMRQLKRFMHCRGKAEKGIAIVLNFVPYTLQHLEQMMEGAIEELHMDPERDYFMVQRIAPTGRACNNYDQWKIQPDLLIDALDAFEYLHERRGFDVKVDTVDVFPWCAIPDKYHYMLNPGGCQWGQPGGVLSVVQDGGIQRCALSERILGNILDYGTPEEFTKFMLENPTLRVFREHRHLDQKCLSCELLEKCGGGCVIAAGRGDPYKTDIVNVGHDYLVP